MDLTDSRENLEALQQRFPYMVVIPVSAEHGEGIPELKDQLRTWLADSGNTEDVKTLQTGDAIAAD